MRNIGVDIFSISYNLNSCICPQFQLTSNSKPERDNEESNELTNFAVSRSKKATIYLIPIGEWVGDECWDLVDELVGFPGVQDPGEPTHLAAAGRPARLLEPVVHDATLPRVVRVPRRGHRGVERPPPGAEAAGGGVGGGGGEGGREGLEGGAEGDEHVVGEERRGEGHEHQRQRAAAATARCGGHGGARGRALDGGRRRRSARL